MDALTTALSATIPGPDWLVERRTTAAVGALARPMPDTHEEVWRYSRVAELDLGEFTPVRSPGELTVPAGAEVVLSSLGEIAGAVVARNGFVVHAHVDRALVDAGVRLGRLGETNDGGDALGSVLESPTDVFAHLNDGFCSDPVLLDVPAGVVIERPFVVVDWVDSDGIVVFPRLVVRAGADSESTVVEWHGSADVRSLACVVTELDVGPGARLGHVNVQQRGEHFWQIASQVSRVDRDATLVAAQAALGGDYARTHTVCRLAGTGATGDLLAAYFAHGDQMLDFRTFQEHQEPDTTSNLLFEGVLDDRSRSVYTGTIKVDKGAKGTNALQTNRNLKLSDGTWTESVPNLEIENNDVRCSHASTIGPVDADQRFYLESRGVPPRQAEQLIVSGFFDEVLEQLPVAAVAKQMRAEIDVRLTDGGREEVEP